MRKITIPKIMIAGDGGDSGKTIISCAFAKLLARRGVKVVAFKKGPDYIDAAWLSAASGSQTRNLDAFLMGEDYVRNSFALNSQGADFAIVEGNRGVYDGMDSKGSFSSANLAKILKTPVVLALPVRKTTRTVAARALGLKLFDESLNIAGVVLNFAAGRRHRKVVAESIESEAGLQVFGALPKIAGEKILPQRHLGLVTPSEYDEEIEKTMNFLADLIEENLDVDAILKIAENAEPLDFDEIDKAENERAKARIGYFKDRAFSFYYPENLEALEREGVELVEINSLEDERLPEIDGLYIGGGFPETSAAAISQNKSMLESVKEAVEKNAPVYAECGGLIYLTKSLEYEGEKYEMANVFDAELKLEAKPPGHGYFIGELMEDSIFFAKGSEIRGHEFHYSRPVNFKDVKRIVSVKRGSGFSDKTDGLTYKNAFASYAHIHAASHPEWARRFAESAEKYKIKQL